MSMMLENFLKVRELAEMTGILKKCYTSHTYGEFDDVSLNYESLLMFTTVKYFR